MEIFNMEQTEAWDALVRGFSNYDVYYLSGYVKAFQLHGDGEPLLFYGEADGVRGINVVMKRDIAADSHFAGSLPTDTYFDFATPYGYGGWLLEGEGDPAPIFADYERWCGKHGIVSEFVRYHPVLNNHTREMSFYDVTALGGTIAIDLSSPETIWANLTTQNRGRIRKARRNGVRIYTGRSPELFETFREIYNATMDKDNATDYYYFAPSFYESVCEDLPHNSEVFYAQLPDGTVIAAAIMLWANGRMNYHLGGFRTEYGPIAPTNLLMYEAALWGCEAGCKTLHLGGGVGSGEDNLFRFKKTFYRGEPCRYHIGKKIFDEEKYAMLCAMRSDLPDSGFFPRYRA